MVIVEKRFSVKILGRDSPRFRESWDENLEFEIGKILTSENLEFVRILGSQDSHIRNLLRILCENLGFVRILPISENLADFVLLLNKSTFLKT